MIKLRIHGTTEEIKRFRRILERNKHLTVVKSSEVLPQKDSQKFFHLFMDLLTK